MLEQQKAKLLQQVGTFIKTPFREVAFYLLGFLPGSSEPSVLCMRKNNLLSLFRLVVKEVISCSLNSGGQLSSDHPVLRDFFILLEDVLLHGLQENQVGKLSIARNIYHTGICVKERNMFQE